MLGLEADIPSCRKLAQMVQAEALARFSVELDSWLDIKCINLVALSTLAYT